MEDPRRYLNAQFIYSPEDLNKAAMNNNFENFQKINEEYSCAVFKCSKVKFSRPIAVAAAILDRAKLLMYRFHYGTIVPHFTRSRVQVAYSDTDSFIYSIRTPNLNEQLNILSKFFDFSNYDPEHYLHNPSTQNQLLLVKDECAGRSIESFCGLRSKMYSFKFRDDEGVVVTKKAAKGVSKTAIEKCLSFRDYTEALFDQRSIYLSSLQIRSKSHVLSTYTIRKRSLSSFDDKTFVLQDGVSTRPYGHYRNKYTQYN